MSDFSFTATLDADHRVLSADADGTVQSLRDAIASAFDLKGNTFSLEWDGGALDSPDMPLGDTGMSGDDEIKVVVSTATRAQTRLRHVYNISDRYIPCLRSLLWQHAAARDQDNQLVHPELAEKAALCIDAVSAGNPAAVLFPCLAGAAAQGDLDTISFLAEAGAVLDYLPPPPHSSGTALHNAAGNGQTAAAALLLDLGADVDYVEPSAHSTALLRACTRGAADTVALLLSRGAAPDPPGHRSPLGAACLARSADTVEVLLQRGGVDVNRYVPALEGTALYAAVAVPDILRALLASGADVEAKQGPAWETVLAVAAARGRCQSVEILLEHGADPNTQDATQWSPLMLAVANDRADVVAKLLACPRTDLDLTNADNRTAYDLAQLRWRDDVMSQFQTGEKGGEGEGEEGQREQEQKEQAGQDGGEGEGGQGDHTEE